MKFAWPGPVLKRTATSIPFVVVVSLALGLVISSIAIERPHVAVVSLSGVIESEQGTQLGQILREVTDDPAIRAVVLEIDSPGGLAVTSQQIYMDVLKLRQEKPVVAAIIGAGASGGYYICAGCNYIYALPASEVGSIGAIVGLPQLEELDEQSITTGPSKATGGTREDTLVDLEVLRQEFVSAVVENRGDRLTVTPEELSRAQVYSGTGALEAGLIDEIGTWSDAIDRAASLARIRHYSVSVYDSSASSISSFEALKSRALFVPVYYYLHFESR